MDIQTMIAAQLRNMGLSSGVMQPSSDLDSIKLTTASLGSELQEMKRVLTEMQANGHEKDAEIMQLNMHLAEEKRKLQEAMMGGAKGLNSLLGTRNASEAVNANKVMQL
jgi:hypothetical protein